MTTPRSIPPLEELAFTDIDYAWDAAQAAGRLQSNLGWGALAAYSLAVDFSADPESFETYRLLVVDYVGDEPRIVPEALKYARESLSLLDADTREKVQYTLSFLEEKLSRSEKTVSPPVTPAAADDESQVEGIEELEPSAGTRSGCVGREEASRIVERLMATGQVLPAWGRDALVGFISGLSGEETLSMDGFEKISPVKYFTKLLRSLPSFLPTGEASKTAPVNDTSLEALGRRIARSLEH